jgi:hypothetical protein
LYVYDPTSLKVAMATPRRKKFAIRPKARIALMVVFASVQAAGVPLLAHPTRTIGHGSARRLPAATAPRESLRERPARRAIAKPLTTHRAANGRAATPRPMAFGAPAQVSHRTSSGRLPSAPNPTNHGPGRAGASNQSTAEQQDASANPATLDRVHAWEQAQREAAAQSSITAADAEIASVQGSPANDSLSSSPLNGGNTSAQLQASPGPRLAGTIADDVPASGALPSLQPLLLYDNLGRLVVPAPLYGSHEVLLHQNQMADRDGLTRVQNDAGLLALLRQKKLVPLPLDDALRVDYRLPANRRYSRPWTAQFLAALAHDHFAAFHSPIQVDSAVRTVQFQRRLMRTNGNAAPAAGDTASPHLTGQAVDIAKSSLTLTEIAWMRAYLQPLIEAGKIDVEEEFQQACFHISVYKDYLPTTPSHATVAATRQPQTPTVY